MAESARQKAARKKREYQFRDRPSPAEKRRAKKKKTVTQPSKPKVSQPAPKKELTAFEKLAQKRGVDLPAEQARATRQILSGQAIGGTTQATLNRQRVIKQSERQQTLSIANQSLVQLGQIPGKDTKLGSERRSWIDKAFGAIQDYLNVNTVYSETGDYPLFSNAGIRLDVAIIGGVGVGGVTSTAVSQLSKIGTIGLPVITAGVSRGFAGPGIAGAVAGGTAATIATNTATKAATASWLTSLGFTGAAAGLLLTSVGSYPFAGFIKEEALQTISFGLKVALENGDWEGAARAIALTEEILNPGMSDRIKAGIPFANILDQLDNFFEAARVKLAIDKKLFADLQTRETEDERWARIKKEEDDAMRAYKIWSLEQQKRFNDNEREARAQQRNEDAAFWAKESEKQRKLDEADRKAQADFWFEYRKRIAELSADSRPSRLNFGLL